MVLASATLVQCLALDVSTTCLDVSADGATVCVVHRKSCFVWHCHPADNNFTTTEQSTNTATATAAAAVAGSAAPNSDGAAAAAAGADGVSRAVSRASTGTSNLSRAGTEVRELAAAMGFQVSSAATTTNTAHGKQKGKQRTSGHFVLLARLNRYGTVHQKEIRVARLTRDGEHVITCGDDLKIAVWSVQTKKVVRIMTGHRDVIFDAVLSSSVDANGRGSSLLYTGSADGYVLCWDWRTGTLLGTVAREASAVQSVAVLPSIASSKASSTSAAALGSASASSAASLARGGANTTGGVASGRLCVACSDGSVGFWDIATKRKIGGIAPDSEWWHERSSIGVTAVGWLDPQRYHSGALVTTRLSPNGLYLATASTDSTCKLWSVLSLRKDTATVMSYGSGITTGGRARDRDTKTDIDGDGGDGDVGSDSEASAGTRREAEAYLSGTGAAAAAVAAIVAAGGSRIGTGANRRLQSLASSVGSSSTAALTQALTKASPYGSAQPISRAAITLASVGQTRALEGDEMPLAATVGFHGTLLFTFRHEATVEHLEFSSDSRLLFTASLDCSVKIWDVDSGCQVFQINVPYAPTGIHLHPATSDERASSLNETGLMSLGRLHVAVQSRILVFQIDSPDSKLDASRASTAAATTVLNASNAGADVDMQTLPLTYDPTLIVHPASYSYSLPPAKGGANGTLTSPPSVASLASTATGTGTGTGRASATPKPPKRSPSTMKGTITPLPPAVPEYTGPTPRARVLSSTVVVASSPSRNALTATTAASTSPPAAQSTAVVPATDALHTLASTNAAPAATASAVVWPPPLSATPSPTKQRTSTDGGSQSARGAGDMKPRRRPAKSGAAIAQFGLAPDFLVQLLAQLTSGQKNDSGANAGGALGIDKAALSAGMKHYGVSPAQLLRALTASKYYRAPQILQALSSSLESLEHGSSVEMLWQSVVAGDSMDAVLHGMGYIPINQFNRDDPFHHTSLTAQHLCYVNLNPSKPDQAIFYSKNDEHDFDAAAPPASGSSDEPVTTRGRRRLTEHNPNAAEDITPAAAAAVAAAAPVSNDNRRTGASATARVPVKFAPSRQLNLLSLIKAKRRPVPESLHSEVLNHARQHHYPLFGLDETTQFVESKVLTERRRASVDVQNSDFGTSTILHSNVPGAAADLTATASPQRRRTVLPAHNQPPQNSSPIRKRAHQKQHSSPQQQLLSPPKRAPHATTIRSPPAAATALPSNTVPHPPAIPRSPTLHLVPPPAAGGELASPHASGASPGAVSVERATRKIPASKRRDLARGGAVSDEAAAADAAIAAVAATAIRASPVARPPSEDELSAAAKIGILSPFNTARNRGEVGSMRSASPPTSARPLQHQRAAAPKPNALASPPVPTAAAAAAVDPVSWQTRHRIEKNTPIGIAAVPVSGGKSIPQVAAKQTALHRFLAASSENQSLVSLAHQMERINGVTPF